MNRGGGKVAPSGGGLFGGMFGGRNNNAKSNQLELERQRQEELIKEQLRALEIDMEEEKKRQEALVQETVKRQQEEQEAKRLEEEATRKREEEEAARKRQEEQEAKKRQKEEEAAKRKEARKQRALEAARKREEQAAAKKQQEEQAVAAAKKKQEEQAAAAAAAKKLQEEQAAARKKQDELETTRKKQEEVSTRQRRKEEDTAKPQQREEETEPEVSTAVQTTDTTSTLPSAEVDTNSSSEAEQTSKPPVADQKPGDVPSSKGLSEQTGTKDLDSTVKPNDAVVGEPGSGGETKPIVTESLKKKQVKTALSSHFKKLIEDTDTLKTNRHGDEISLGTLELDKQSQNKAAAARARRARRHRSRASRDVEKPWGQDVPSRDAGVQKAPTAAINQASEEEKYFFSKSQAKIFEKSAFNFDLIEGDIPEADAPGDEKTPTEEKAEKKKDSEDKNPDNKAQDSNDGMDSDDIDLEQLDMLENEGEYKHLESRLSEKLAEKFENAWQKAEVDKKFVAELKALRGDKKTRSSPDVKSKSRSKANAVEDIPRLYLFESEKEKGKKKKKKKGKKKKKKEDTTLTKEFKMAMKDFFEPEVEEEYVLGPGAFGSFPTDGFAAQDDDSSQSSVSVSSVESMDDFTRALREKSLKKPGTDDDDRSYHSRKSNRSKGSRRGKSRGRSSSRGHSPSSRSTSPMSQSVASSRYRRGRSPSVGSVASKRSAGSVRSGKLPPTGKGKGSTPPLTRRPFDRRCDRSQSSDGSVGSNRHRHRHRRLPSGGQSEDEKSAVSRARTEAPRRRLPSSGHSVASSRRGSRSVRSAPAYNTLDPAEFYAREVKRQSAKPYSTDSIRKELEEIKRQSAASPSRIPPKLRPPKSHMFSGETRTRLNDSVFGRNGSDPFATLSPGGDAGPDPFMALSPSNGKSDGLGFSSDEPTASQPKEEPGDKKGIFGKVAASSLIVSRLKAAASRAKQQKPEFQQSASSDDMEDGLLSA